MFHEFIYACVRFILFHYSIPFCYVRKKKEDTTLNKNKLKLTLIDFYFYYALIGID